MKGKKSDFYFQNLKNKIKLFANQPSYIGFYLNRFIKYNSLTSFPLMIVSYPKSGRTWLQKMIIESIKLDQGIQQNISDISELSNFDSLPNILSTHAGSSWEEIVLTDEQVKVNDWNKYAHAKTIFLYRDPRDVLVSQYYHIIHRTGYTSFDKKYLISNKNVGLLKIIHFMNKWKRFSDENPHDIIEVSYEKMKSNPNEVLSDILTFWNFNITDRSLIDQAIQNCSLKNMRKAESENSTSPWSHTSSTGNQNSFQSRKGIIGEYKDFFSTEEVEKINDIMHHNLVKSFNY